MTDEVRKWTDKPYGPNDSQNFSIFERDLIDDLQEKKGFPQVLWNSPSDPDAAKYLHMIQYVEKDTAKILEESEMNAKEELEEETETVSTIAYAKKSYSKQLVTKFYGHKLRDFSSKKIKQWQTVENVTSLIEESRFALYDILRKRTKGGVLDEVRRLRDKNVEHTRGKIAELFGMETYDDNKQLEEQLSKGIAKHPN